MLQIISGSWDVNSTLNFQNISNEIITEKQNDSKNISHNFSTNFTDLSLETLSVNIILETLMKYFEKILTKLSHHIIAKKVTNFSYLHGLIFHICIFHICMD